MRLNNATPAGRRRRNAVLLAALASSTALVAQLGATGPSAAATAVPAFGSPVAEAFVEEVGVETIRNQEALMDLRAWMHGQPGFADSGYVGSIDGLPEKATTIMWHGPRTGLLAAILAEGARRGIRVSVQPRRYSLAQLEAAVDAVWQQQEAGLWAGFKISTIEAVGAVEDGLTVRGAYTATTRTAARAPQVQSLSTTVNGIPVRVKPGETATAQVGRSDDYSPFYGGGYMASPSTGGKCSNGFGVQINGIRRTITARHCTANDYQSRDASGSSHQYGTGVATSSEGVRALSKPGSAYIFRGAWNQTNSISGVKGWAYLAVNGLVCTSGGNSGEHCNIKISNMYVTWNDGFGVIATVRGDQQTSGAITSMQGDSGGPVFALNPSGTVWAAGMIQAGVSGTNTSGPACGPSHDVEGRPRENLLCSTSLLFTPFTRINSGLNAQLLVV